jgi:hypothetical protein
VRAVLDCCRAGGGGEAASIDPGWGEPGLTAAEKIYGWNSFMVGPREKVWPPSPGSGGTSEKPERNRPKPKLGRRSSAAKMGAPSTEV